MRSVPALAFLAAIGAARVGIPLVIRYEDDHMRDPFSGHPHRAPGHRLTQARPARSYVDTPRPLSKRAKRRARGKAQA